MMKGLWRGVGLGDTAVVRAAAVGRDRTHLVLVMPELFARDGVDGIHVVV
jgi:hypothetical protein